MKLTGKQVRELIRQIDDIIDAERGKALSLNDSNNKPDNDRAWHHLGRVEGMTLVRDLVESEAKWKDLVKGK